MRSKSKLFPDFILRFTTTIVFTLWGLCASSQTLPALPFLESTDPQGFFFFEKNKLPMGSCFGSLKDSLLKNALESVMVTKSWSDPFLNLQHVRYQQYYNGIMVEGAEFIEHGKGGYIMMANGKLAHDLPVITTAPMSEAVAVDRLITYLGANNFPWTHADWEAQIKEDTGDSTATYYPQGTLVWSLDNLSHLGFTISGSRYRLGWRFDVLTLAPNPSHMQYFVDAFTGDVYRKDPLDCNNGPADILTQGTRTIDTQPDLFDFQLHATEMGRDIRTKYYDAAEPPWGSIPNIKDNDDNWGTSEQLGTTAHWMVMQAWDFFKWQYSLNGMDGTGDQVRVYANYKDPNAFYREDKGKDYMFFGDASHYYAVIDVTGHEFTHGVTKHSAALIYANEPGALNESFSDIFGVMVERYAQSGVYDWTMAEDATTNPYYVRSLSDPFTHGSHFPAWANCSLLGIGQPDTYEGPYWYGPYGCDFGGVHVNSGVQNKWFYLLSEGGTHNGIEVKGIGIDQAAYIAYYSLTNVLISSSQYADARASAIAVAQMLFGACSNEEVQTQNAWAAVGVGTKSTCTTIAVDPETENPGKVEIFPNPSSGHINIRCWGPAPDAIIVTDLSGKLIASKVDQLSANMELDLSGQAPGMYIFSVVRQGQARNLKVILQ